MALPALVVQAEAVVAVLVVILALEVARLRTRVVAAAAALVRQTLAALAAPVSSLFE